MQRGFTQRVSRKRGPTSGSFASPRPAPMASVCTTKKVVATVEQYADENGHLGKIPRKVGYAVVEMILPEEKPTRVAKGVA